MPGSSSVETMATTMPAAAVQLPRTAVLGFVRPMSPRMNSEKATRYPTAATVVMSALLATARSHRTNPVSA